MQFGSRSTRSCLPGSQNSWHLTQGQVRAVSTGWAGGVQGSQAQPTPTASPLQLQPPQMVEELWVSLDSLVSPRTSCFQPWLHIKII